MQTLTLETLRNATHDLQTPFAIVLDSDAPLICEKVLRLLPKKRIVCQCTWQSQTVIAKIFIDPIHAARHLKRETQGLNALHTAQIPAPKIIHQTPLSNGAHVLITEFLTGAVALSTLLNKNISQGFSKTSLEKIIKLIAQLHQSGLSQKDLHLDNFLSKQDKLYCIDGAAVDHHQQGHPLNWKKSLNNLALFFAQFNGDANTMIEAGWATYQHERPQTQQTNGHLQLHQAIQSQLRKRKQILRIRIIRDGTAYVCKKSFRQFLVCTRPAYTPAMQQLLKNPDQAIENGEILKKGGSSTVARITLDQQPLIIKRFNIKTPLKFFRRQIPPSRARRGWWYAHLLGFHDISTAKPIAMLEKRFGPLRSTGYLITESLDAHDIAHSLMLNKNNPDTQHEILTRFTQVLKQLALLNISHGDFKATNFFDTLPTTSIIDLDAMTHHRLNIFFQKAHQKDRDRLLKNFHADTTLYKLAQSILDSRE